MSTNTVYTRPSFGPTPDLTPAGSADVSPAFSEIITSPKDSTIDLELVDLGEAAEQRKLPECWGHRGASASFPENTRASFIEACKAGADGIETDIHITSDNVLVMFHDPELGRTTTGSGRIDKQPWHGVLEHVRTKAAPVQPIPRLTEVIEILLTPGHEDVKLNIDCKVENEPYKLFRLLKDVIQSHDAWATRLAPRIILGIWHPKFIIPAVEILPYLPRFAITMSIPQCRTYFFTKCHGFSVLYEALASEDGARFRADCFANGKDVCTWTVNHTEEMRECVKWGVRAVISDKPELWRQLKMEIEADFNRLLVPATHAKPFVSKASKWSDHELRAREEREYLEREGGAFDDVFVPDVSLQIVRPADVLA